MPNFSNRSKRRLKTCDRRLQDACNAVIKVYNITVLCGHRGEIEQNAAVASGASFTVFPNSRHNSNPSRAVDIAPWPVNWEDIDRFVVMSYYMKGAISALGYDIEWGGDWPNFKDYPHWQV